MVENNRKPIASLNMFPQFTTMNVIDGQAGIIIYSSLICYSLTIDNILNIIVLLILAGVTIATLTGDNGLLNKAKLAVNLYSDSEVIEQIKLAHKEWQMSQYTGNTENINDFIKDRLNNIYKDNFIKEISKIGKALIITFSDNKIFTYNISTDKVLDITNNTNISKSKNENFVGFYADIDVDGVIDGVIFADLLVGSIKETQKWGNSEETYTIPTIDSNDLKEYYISQEEYSGIFGNKPVISPKGNGNNRFYIMQLSDYVTNEDTTFYWYYNADRKMNDYDETTSKNFGAGKNNTDKMILKWKDKAYGDLHSQDIWGNISSVVEEGWFIPSKDEWMAFGNELNVTSDKRVQYGFIEYCYHSSSQRTARFVWDAHLYQGNINQIYVNNKIGVRLATAF